MLHFHSENDIDGLRMRVSELDQQVASSEAKHGLEIASPAAGWVTAIASQPGQIVTAGARMNSLIR